MSMDNERELLAPLRDLEPPGPSTVSVAKAIRDGRRRKAAFAAAAAVIVALVAVGLGSLLHRPVPVAAGRFDVLREVFTVGTAGGFTPSTFETGTERQQAVLVPEKGGAGGATVTMYAPGRFTPAGPAAPDVYGRRAVWIGDQSLAFEWGPQAWVTITVTGFDDGRARAQHIADSVGVDATIPVMLPFTLPKPSWPLTGVRVPAGDHVGPATMIFGPISVTLSTGQPAASDHSATVRDAGSGCWVTVDAGTPGALTPEVAHIVDAVRPVADPGHRTGWTTTPWR